MDDWLDPIWELLADSIHQTAGTGNKLTADDDWSKSAEYVAPASVGGGDPIEEEGWEPARFKGAPSALIDAARTAGIAVTRSKGTHVFDLSHDTEAELNFKTTHYIKTYREIEEREKRFTFDEGTLERLRARMVHRP